MVSTGTQPTHACLLEKRENKEQTHVQLIFIAQNYNFWKLRWHCFLGIRENTFLAITHR